MKVEEVEKFSGKVKADIVQIDLLKAENRRLKNFEGANLRLMEANDRLRKYNGELRHALLKEQEQNPAIQIPDGGSRGRKQFSKESLEVTWTQTCNGVVFNSLVMDLIFKKLDVKTIKSCRFICKNWNDTACHILSRQNGGYGLAVQLEERQLKGMAVAIQRQTLHSIVADAPQCWFRKALLHRRFTNDSIENQYFMQTFGCRLRSIEITGRYLSFRDVYEILGNWCPNLEQLALPPYINILPKGFSQLEHDMHRYLGYKMLAFPRPLKLTGLYMQKQFCISIIRASPNLKTLSCCVPDMEALKFFMELQKCSEITRNLEDMTFNCTNERIKCQPMIRVLDFSSKLKNLTINAVGQFQGKELSEALTNLSTTLEKLVLIVTDLQEPGPTNLQLEFPEMKNLTELRYFYLGDAATAVNSIEFMIGMPNLKTLMLGQTSTYPSPDLPSRDKFMDNLFRNSQHLLRNPRNRLKELYLFGVVRSSSFTFQMMNHVFPNLTKLVVGIVGRHKRNKINQLKVYYNEVFEGLSEMPNLKELYLDFRSPSCTDEGEADFDYMSLVFGHLNKLSNVRHLTIRDNSESTTSLVGHKLLEIPNLQRLTLIGLQIELMVAKELTLLLYKRDVQIEFKDTEVEEDFRIHFDEERIFLYRKSLRD